MFKLKPECHNCRAWNPEGTEDYFCYTDSCPAYIQDQKGKNTKQNNKIHMNFQKLVGSYIKKRK